jgi:membrane protein insertase Oxa1/YidC/SpoIIIJ
MQSLHINKPRHLSSLAQFLADPPVPLPVLVPTCTILLRTATTLPLTIYSRKNTIKMLSLQPLISAWSHNLAVQAREGTEQTSMEEWMKKVREMTKAKRKEIYARNACGIWRGFLAGWSTLPVWIAVSYTLRSAVWEEGLVLGSCGWIAHLNETDPYGVLSVAAGAVMFLNAEVCRLADMMTEYKDINWCIVHELQEPDDDEVWKSNKESCKGYGNWSNPHLDISASGQYHP